MNICLFQLFFILATVLAFSFNKGHFELHRQQRSLCVIWENWEKEGDKMLRLLLWLSRKETEDFSQCIGLRDVLFYLLCFLTIVFFILDTCFFVVLISLLHTAHPFPSNHTHFLHTLASLCPLLFKKRKESRVTAARSGCGSERE